MTLAEKYLLLLERRGLRAVDVARAMGVDPSRISELKRGAYSPPPEKLLRLARILGTTADYLADDDQDEPPVPLTADELVVLAAYRRTGAAPEVAIRWLYDGARISAARAVGGAAIARGRSLLSPSRRRRLA